MQESKSASSERHFVWKADQFDNTVNQCEFWVDSTGPPMRRLITLTETSDDHTSRGDTTSSTPNVLRRIEVTYSGFAEPNTITAPITPPTPEPTLESTPTATPTATPTPTPMPTEERPADRGPPPVREVTGSSVRVSWDRVRPAGTFLQDVRVNYRLAGATDWTFGAWVDTRTWNSRRQAATVSGLTCETDYESQIEAEYSNLWHYYGSVSATTGGC